MNCKRCGDTMAYDSDNHWVCENCGMRKPGKLRVKDNPKQYANIEAAIKMNETVCKP